MHKSRQPIPAELSTQIRMRRSAESPTFSPSHEADRRGRQIGRRKFVAPLMHEGNRRHDDHQTQIRHLFVLEYLRGGKGKDGLASPWRPLRYPCLAQAIWRDSHAASRAA